MPHQGLHKKTNLPGMLVLSAFIVLSRYVYKANFLYEWDSVQFALSISKFDILWHRPHPPGYVLYVFCIQAANLLFADPNSAIIFTNIFFSVVTLAIFYGLASAFLEDRRVAFLTAAMLATDPLFWFYGSTATAYVMEAFIATLVGYLLFLALNSSDFRYLLSASFFLGVVGGFRQSAILLMGPLWLYVLIKKTCSRKEILTAFAVFAISTLIWLLPTLQNTRGLENYLAVSGGLTGSSSEKAEILFGGLDKYFVSNTLNFSVWLLQGISPIGFVLICIGLWNYLERHPFKEILKTQKTVFMFLWTVPSALFYLTYIEKSGYLLTTVPPLLILLSWSIIKITSGIRTPAKQAFFRYGTCSLIILMFTAWFIWPSSKDGIPKKINFAASVIQPPLSDYNWDVSSREIRQKNYVMQVFTQILGRKDKYQSSNAVIFSAGGYPTWRHIMYYFPDYKNYWLVDESISGRSVFNCEYYLAEQGIESSYSGLPFWVEGQRPKQIDIPLDTSVKWIVWVLDDKTDLYTYVYSAYSDEFIKLPNDQIVMITPNTYDMIDLGCFMIR